MTVLLLGLVDFLSTSLNNLEFFADHGGHLDGLSLDEAFLM